tara:strand:+ start:332 stop:1324 length:993 start_codon:yes stop_codon:yes gene_type:complete
MPCISNNLSAISQQIELIQENLIEEHAHFKRMSDKIMTFENTLIQKDALILTKDKLLDDKDAEIEKLQGIIASMEDGEGVVDFVNDFIKKDERLIEIQTSQLSTAEEELSESIKLSSKLSHDISKQCRKSLEIELDKMIMKDIRLTNGVSVFETTFSIQTVVDTINSWRRGRCSYGNMTEICVGTCNLYKQNDDGSLNHYGGPVVQVYMDKDVTLTDVKEDPTLYINAFLNITTENGSGTDSGHHNIEQAFGGAFKQRIVVQNDFEPQDGEDMAQSVPAGFMSLSDIWYVENNPDVQINKNYRNSYKSIYLKTIVGAYNDYIRFSYKSDY